MPSGVEFPRSYLRTLLAEDEAARDNAAARAPRVVELDTRVASVTAIDEARARLHPEPETEWRDRAACRGCDPAMFYPGPADLRSARAARDACRTCPVSTQCLASALANEETDGIWGGLSERQRRTVRRTVRATVRDGDWEQAITAYLEVSIGTHGEPATYAHGCRCAPCSLAMSIDRQSRRTQPRRTA